MALKVTLLLAAVTSSHAYQAAPSWPKDDQNKSKGCPQSITVIRDSATGWPAKCQGLQDAVTFLALDNTTKYDNATCKDVCVNQAECDAWQLTPQAQCWISMPNSRGSNCFKGDGRESSFWGQRIQHGGVKVIQSLDGKWVSSGMKWVGTMGASNAAENRARCRDLCYTDITCRYWQFGGFQNPGCWHEAAPGWTVPDPAPISTTSDDAKNNGFGEQIDHFCPPAVLPIGAATKEGGSKLPMILGIIGAVVLALGIIGLLYFFLCHGKGEVRPKKTRAVKITQKKAAEPAVTSMSPMPLLAPTYTTYAAPAPTYQVVAQAPPAVQYIQQPTVVTQAAPVQIMAAPVATVPAAGSIFVQQQQLVR